LAPLAFHYQAWSLNLNDSNWSDVRHLFENVGMGTRCWLKGINPPMTYLDGSEVLGHQYARCEDVLYIVLCYVACNLLLHVFITMTMRHGATSTQLNTTFVAPVVLSYVGLVLYNMYSAGAEMDQNKIGFSGWGSWETVLGAFLVVVGVSLYRHSGEPGVQYETSVVQAMVTP